MNRGNFWIRITVVAIVVTFAAVIGQIERLRNSLRVQPQETPVVVDDKRPRPPKKPAPTWATPSPTAKAPAPANPAG